jgi:hypothetical protein
VKEFLDAVGFERETVHEGVGEIVGKLEWKHHSLTGLE